MKNRRCFIQLGRVGDILNALPLAKHYHDQTGEIPLFMVAGEFASVLEAVSYVQPFIFLGPWEKIMMAILEARKITPDIVVCQIHGDGLCNPRETFSFARESWLSAGAAIPWGSVPLVIDRRDRDREEMAAEPLLQNLCGRKVVLYAGRGTSSPFPFSKPLLEYLKKAMEPEVEVLDLSVVSLPRFTDLCGLFERANCLIAIDTAHQHLAAAFPGLPVVALCTRDPSAWHGSPWRKEHVGRYFYDDFPAACPLVARDVVRALSGALPRKIIHVWADWRTERTEESARRADVAQASWITEYETGRWTPCQVLHEGRRDGTEIGDPHNVNYVHDTVGAGISVATHGEDIIALTNADIGFTPGLTGRVLDMVRRHGAAYTHRRDFDRIERPFVSEASVRRGKFYPGSDAFFFTVDWWRAHRGEYGDFLMGREHWDEVLRQLMKYHGGRSIDHAVWHEWHESFWSGAGRGEIPGNVHNFKLKQAWFARTGLQPEDFRWWQVDEGADRHPPPLVPPPWTNG